MLSIAVVDDDPRCLEEVASAVREHMSARGEACGLAAYSGAETFLAEARTKRFDVAILDIIMPERSGMDAALELHERNKDCHIVFLTASPDYAIQGYRVNAVDYLLKPVDTLSIGRVLDEIHRRARTMPPAFTVILPEGRTAKKVDAADILYCRSHNKRVTFHCADWSMECRGRLADFQARLPAHFVQTHNRYLVNLERVSAMAHGEMRLDNGGAVPISRAFREGAAKQYFDYVSGEARRT